MVVFVLRLFEFRVKRVQNHPSVSACKARGFATSEVGDHVVHTPHAKTGLSSNVGDYYYAYGRRLRASLEQFVKPKPSKW